MRFHDATRPGQPIWNLDHFAQIVTHDEDRHAQPVYQIIGSAHVEINGLWGDNTPIDYAVIFSSDEQQSRDVIFKQIVVSLQNKSTMMTVHTTSNPPA